MSKERELRWWEDDRRVCKDDLRYEDLSSVVPDPELGSKKAQIADMIMGCLTCPVYYECLDDLLKAPRGEHYGIRAAIRGKT